jgi:hypothetical protein
LADSLETTQELSGHEADLEGVVDSLTLPDARMPDQFGMIFRGYVNIPSRGVYTFDTLSNDGSVLWIGDERVVDNDSPHPARLRSGQIALEPGLHPLRLEYFQAGAAKALEVHVAGPGMPRQQIPVEMLVH